MRLRLLHLIQTMESKAGGPVEGVRQLTRVNQQRGHSVEIVSLDPPDAECVRQPDLKIHALGPATGGYGFSRRYVTWLKEHAHEYDCLIVNGIWSFVGLGAWLALRETRVPYVVFTHGMLDPWFKYKYPLKHIKKWLYWPWGQYPVLRDAEAVFFTCDQERLLARQSFWLYDCHEISVRYGTAGVPDPARDYRPAFLEKHPALAGKRLFLFLGRVHFKKGPDLLIQAVGRLLRAGIWDPETMRLVMAGPDDSAYARSLQKLARSEGLTSVIHWTGLLTGDAKWGVLQAAETFLLPSHQENFGVAVAEALSANVPVLISHAVNISPEIAADGAGLVDHDTVEGCQATLERWLAMSEPDRAKMRAQARVTFLARYTAEEAAKDLLKNIYLMLAARTTRRPRTSLFPKFISSLSTRTVPPRPVPAVPPAALPASAKEQNPPR